jgi:hypothetical protein
MKILSIYKTERSNLLGTIVMVGTINDETTNKSTNFGTPSGLEESIKWMEEAYESSEEIGIRYISAEMISDQTVDTKTKEIMAYVNLLKQFENKYDKALICDKDYEQDEFITLAKLWSKEEIKLDKITITKDLGEIYSEPIIIALCYSYGEMVELNRKYDCGYDKDKQTLYIKKHVKHKPRCNKGCECIRWNIVKV